MTDLSRAAMDMLIADRRLDAITNHGAVDDYRDAWRALADAVARVKDAMRGADGLDPIRAV